MRERKRQHPIFTPLTHGQQNIRYLTLKTITILIQIMLYDNIARIVESKKEKLQINERVKPASEEQSTWGLGDGGGSSKRESTEEWALAANLWSAAEASPFCLTFGDLSMSSSKFNPENLEPYRMKYMYHTVSEKFKRKKKKQRSIIYLYCQWI